MASEQFITIKLRWWCLPLVKLCCFVLKWLPFIGAQRKMKMAYAICGWLTQKAVKVK